MAVGSRRSGILGPIDLSNQAESDEKNDKQ